MRQVPSVIDALKPVFPASSEVVVYPCFVKLLLVMLVELHELLVCVDAISRAMLAMFNTQQSKLQVEEALELVYVVSAESRHSGV